ncbi:MAG: hypothetical protein IKP95_00220 [Ruminococcus sp.]|nr:hypothetical protein [Ruminococcus sp.]
MPNNHIDTGLMIIAIVSALLMMTAFGSICVYIMRRKGYPAPFGWFFCGFCLGFFGLILCIVMTDFSKKPSQGQQQRQIPQSSQPPQYTQPQHIPYTEQYSEPDSYAEQLLEEERKQQSFDE